MDQMTHIVIDDVQDDTMLASVVGRSDIESPEAEYESTYIDGVDGSVNRFMYYKDVEQVVEFNILEEYNVKPQIRKLKSWLLNAQTFYFSDDDVYRKVKQVKIAGIKNDIAEYGDFEATFTCDPFEYAREVPVITATSGIELDNFGTYKALPLITIYGSGQSTFTIGDQQFAVDLQKDYTTIDSTIGECYYQNTNLNAFMTGKFPILPPGKTNISWTGAGVTKVEIERRCRYL